MKTHFEIRSVRKGVGSTLAAMFALCFLAFAISGQAPPNPVPAQENIQSGALVIPMDNVNQGNAGGTTFNLRAYGLANLLLQNNIPVKWAIKPGKSKDDTDFSANVTRITGSAGTAGPASVSFSGGPFIVQQQFDSQALRDLIASFNSGGTPVTVYKTNGDALVDIRYTLTHKPKIAIGPDGGNFGTSVHQGIFSAAGIGSEYYAIVDNSIINANSCYTLATQAHSTDAQFVSLYKQFAQSGGNLLLQCASINTYENNAAGHFQTTVEGYDVFGTNDGTNVSTTLIYPEGSMPFNQFIGILANQDGAITEYRYDSGGGPINGNRISVRNSGDESAKFVATVSQLNGDTAGGTVFELGSHDYARLNTVEPDATALAMLNGQRMLLNAVFVPVTRPEACRVEQPKVLGYKSVRRVVPDSSLGGPIQPGNTVEWTIDYINNSPSDITDFQIADVIQANLTLAPGPGNVVLSSLTAGSTASIDGSYDGVGNANLLAAGATLKSGARIQIRVRMTVNANTPSGTILKNQTVASGLGIVANSDVNSDNVDATSINIADLPPPASGSVPQTMVPNSNDPTTFPITFAPTAAAGSIDGEIRSTSGAGIANARVTVVNGATGETKYGVSNSFGHYRIEDLEVGQFYLVTVTHRRYKFSGGPVSFTLSDSVTGLTFIGRLTSKAQPVSSKSGLGETAGRVRSKR